MFNFYQKHSMLVDFVMLAITACVTTEIAITAYFNHAWHDSLSMTLWVCLGIVGSLAAFFAVKLIIGAAEIYRDDPYRRHRKRPWVS